MHEFLLDLRLRLYLNKIVHFHLFRAIIQRRTRNWGGGENLEQLARDLVDRACRKNWIKKSEFEDWFEVLVFEQETGTPADIDRRMENRRWLFVHGVPTTPDKPDL